MKIGVMGLFYGAPELLEKVLSPWIELRKEGRCIIAVVNAQFTEYAEMGVPDDDEVTRTILRENEDKLDFLHLSDKPLLDKEARNIALEYLLKQNVDLIWIVDGDELYTREQIEAILQYVDKTPQFDYYHINFDNLILGEIHYDEFFPPRIFRTDRHGGLDKFIFDNELLFKNGLHIYKSTLGIVPKRVAHITHHTWRQDNIMEKIVYNHRHLGFCPIRFDLETKKVSLDPSYFKHWKMPFPEVSEDGKWWRIRRKKPQVFLSLSGNFIGREQAFLIPLISVLILFHANNDYDIKLTLVTRDKKEIDPEGVPSLLDICPFETDILETDAEIEGGCVFSESECVRGQNYINHKLTKYVSGISIE